MFHAAFPQKSLLTVLIILTAAWLSGCASNRDILLRSYTCLDVDDYQTSKVFTAAEQTMRGEFGPLTVDTDQNTIESRPRSVDVGRPSLSTQNYRQMAEMKIVHVDGRNWLCVRVATMRQDSQAWSAYTRSGPDQHYVSPMESGLALDQSRKEIWTTTRRDRQLERQLIQKTAKILKPTRPQ